MKVLYNLSAVAIILFLSCTSGNEHQGATTSSDTTVVSTTSTLDKTLPAGKVVDSIICNNDNNQSYALYLPSNYTVAKQYPCIYFFDAHARGSMPVRMYKDIAEQYGFILIGSNVSRNGIKLDAIQEIVQVLITDSKSRINIDPQRVYTSGFSGGARVAGFVAQQDSNIIGVIGCAAGFLQNGQQAGRMFNYFGIVGTDDFNWMEMQGQDEMLEQYNFTHQLLTYPGKHGWAPANDFRTALCWMMINELKGKKQLQNESAIKGFKDDFDKRITTATAAGEWITTYKLLTGIIKTLDGIADITVYKNQLAKLNASPQLVTALNLRKELQQKEIDGQQELINQFASHDEHWWAVKIATLKQKKSSIQETQMNNRLISYLGFVAYMNINHALTTGDLANAVTYLHIFKIADPKNLDCDYLQAIYDLKKGDDPKAITSLEHAISLGYNDVLQLRTEPAFSRLQSNAAFVNIINEAIKNSRKAQP